MKYVVAIVYNIDRPFEKIENALDTKLREFDTEEDARAFLDKAIEWELVGRAILFKSVCEK